MLNTANFIQNMVNETLTLSDNLNGFENHLLNFLKLIPNSRKSRLYPHKKANFTRIIVNKKTLDIPLKYQAFRDLRSNSFYFDIKYLNKNDCECSFASVISKFLEIPICPTFITYKKQKYLLFFTDFEIKKLDQLINKYYCETDRAA